MVYFIRPLLKRTAMAVVPGIIRPLAEPDRAWGFLGKSERETPAYMRYMRYVGILSELLTPKASARYRLCKRSIFCLCVVFLYVASSSASLSPSASSFLSASAFPSCSLSASAFDEKMWLKKIESYLNEAKSWTARFEQFSPDGSFSTGTCFVSRPGKLRLTYTYPEKGQTLVADGKWLIIYNASTEELTTLPLHETPADFFLREPVTFSQDITVKGLEFTESKIKVTLMRTQDPEAGYLTLVFQQNPLQLIQWTIVDAHRLKTTVKIQDIRFVSGLDPRLFVFERPDLLAP